MQIYGISNVDDYVYQSKQCESMTLYDWVCLATKQKIPKTVLKSLKNTDKHIVDKICDHCWEKNHVQFLVKWDARDKTWKSYTNCSHLYKS